jgi:arginyl-tRNA synthetase
MKDLLHHLAQLLAAAAGVEIADIEPHLVPPPKPEMGDLALPCFALSKRLRKPPAEIAAAIAQAFRGSPEITGV